MMEMTRVLLAVVFAVAGIAKLADRQGARRALREFGIPARLTGALALLLPLVELGIAAGLVPGASARATAGAAAGLLVLFALAISIALLRRRTPDCHCFGRFHAGPAGWGTLARNLALAAVAALVFSQPASDPGWIELAMSGVAAAVAGQGLLWCTLLGRYGRALRRIEELEADEAVGAGLVVGEGAPAFTLSTLRGGRVSLQRLLARGRPVLLAFVDARCGPCKALLPDLGRWQRELVDQVTIAIIGRGDVAALRAMVDGEQLELLVSVDGAVGTHYRVDGTPSAVLVARDGTIASPLHYSLDGIYRLATAGGWQMREPAREQSFHRIRRPLRDSVGVAVVR